MYSVKQAAAFLKCCERKLRKEIAEQRITYRRGPGGIVFTEEDLLDRLRPSPGPSAKHPLKNRKGFPDIHDHTTQKHKAARTRSARIRIELGYRATLFVRFPADQAAVEVQITTTCDFVRTTNS